MPTSMIEMVGLVFLSFKINSVCALHGLVGLYWFECGSHFVQVDILGVFLQEHIASPLGCLHVCVIMLLAAQVFAYSPLLKSYRVKYVCKRVEG